MSTLPAIENNEKLCRGMEDMEQIFFHYTDLLQIC